MPCVNLAIPVPQIPPIFLALPAFNFTLSLGELGITCCNIKFPLFHIPIPIPLAGTSLATLISVLNALIVAAMPLIDLNLPNCPLNGKTLGQ